MPTLKRHPPVTADPSVRTNRDWMRAAVMKAEKSGIGTAGIDAARISSASAYSAWPLLFGPATAIRWAPAFLASCTA